MARKQVTEADPPRKRRPMIFAMKIAFWALVAYFAVEGGEYGTSDLLNVRRRIVEAKVAIDSLKLVTDSLATERKRVMTDPVVQERIAREKFGMVRGDKELMYHVMPSVADSVGPESIPRVPLP
jgi:cell division protein FtsB